MFERFTPSARAVVAAARDEAGRRNEHLLGTHHLLLGLLHDPGRVRDLLLDGGLDTPAADAAIDAFVNAKASSTGTGSGGTEVDADALASLGIDLEQVRRAVEGTFGTGALQRAAIDVEERRRAGRWRRIRRRRHRNRRPDHAGCSPAGSGRTPFNPRAKTVLELSLREAIRLEHQHIRPEHLALGILREGHGLACLILRDAGFDLGELRGAIEQVARAQPRS